MQIVGYQSTSISIFMILMFVLLCNPNVSGDEYHYVLSCPFFKHCRTMHLKPYFYIRLSCMFPQTKYVYDLLLLRQNYSFYFIYQFIVLLSYIFYTIKMFTIYLIYLGKSLYFGNKLLSLSCLIVISIYSSIMP